MAFSISAKVASMTQLCAILLNLSLLSLSALVTDSTRGAPPVVPIDVRTKLVAREGSVFRLSCPAKGDPQPLVTWSKDGETIGAGWSRFKTHNGDKELRIKNVEVEDEGLYNCKAVNGFGSVDIKYHLEVLRKEEDIGEIGDEYDSSELATREPNGKSAPYWMDPNHIRELTQAPVVKRIGSNVKLKCYAGGHPAPEVQWFKDTKEIDDGWRSTWTLLLKDVKESDSGKYTCRVSNIFGTLNATFDILVFDGSTSPPVISGSHPINTTVEEGLQAKLQCKVKSSVPPLIQWLKKVDADSESEYDNNSLIAVQGHKYIMLEPAPHRTTKQPNSTFVNELVLSKVSEQHTGWYVCVVTNPAGHMLYRSAYLKVLKTNQRPIGDTFPLHILVGVPVAVGLLLAVGYAIWFLQRYQKKTEGLVVGAGVRPPPPNCPPPSLPSTRKSFPPYKDAYKHYHHLDPASTAPLKGYGDCDPYETTPQPYELQYDQRDFSDSYTELSGPHRVQHYPSMYSCS